jgi:GNAT superfamily N-acetyltransferase
MDIAAVLELFDEQLRRHDGDKVDDVVRSESRAGNWINHSALSEDNADAAIAAQVAYFSGLGQPFEWKYYDYDTPADLPARLMAAGFAAEAAETVLVAEVGSLLSGPVAEVALPDGVRLLPIDDDEGFAAVSQLQSAVWGGDHDDTGPKLAAEYAADPDGIALFRAVAGDTTVCTGWVRFHPGTDFASLWGGSTLPGWRRRGIYRAMVAHRARLAADRGFTYLQVDASDDSRPILQRLGFFQLTTTTPYIWSP